MQIQNKWNKNHDFKVHNETIKCPSCGYDTGLSVHGFLMVIPDGGLKCDCGATIIQKPKIWM